MRHRYRQRTVLAAMIGLVLLVLFAGGVHVFLEAADTSHIGHLLMAAVRNNNPASVRELLAMGVDPNFERRGVTPLKIARENRYLEIERLLIQAGAQK